MRILQSQILQGDVITIDQNELDIEIRFDVAEVILGNGKPKIDIIKNGMNAY